METPLNELMQATPRTRAYSEVTGLLDRLSDSLDDVTSDLTSDEDLSADSATNNEAVLRMALIAMTEAQRRIERQAQRIKELEALSVTDELTGVLNRRGFNMELRKALAEARRNESEGLVVMIDLDHFKAVNDTFGHAAGDALLSHVGALLLDEVRETDTVARLGGDEFALLLHHLQGDEARDKIKSISDRLNSASVSWRGSKLKIHASVGGMTYTKLDTPVSVLEQADQLMYSAKSEKKASN